VGLSRNHTSPASTARSTRPPPTHTHTHTTSPMCTCCIHCESDHSEYKNPDTPNQTLPTGAAATAAMVWTAARTLTTSKVPGREDDTRNAPSTMLRSSVVGSGGFSKPSKMLATHRGFTVRIHTRVHTRIHTRVHTRIHTRVTSRGHGEGGCETGSQHTQRRVDTKQAAAATMETWVERRMHEPADPFWRQGGQGVPVFKSQGPRITRHTHTRHASSSVFSTDNNRVKRNQHHPRDFVLPDALCLSKPHGTRPTNELHQLLTSSAKV
jgi:hypothetical protein